MSRIVFRFCVRTSRRQRGRAALDVLPEPAHRSDPGAALAAWQLLARFAPRPRAVLHLTVVEGMTDAQIAPLLAITPASVRAHRRRARAHIARMLERGRP